jgi:hypothetical protein
VGEVDLRKEPGARLRDACVGCGHAGRQHPRAGRAGARPCHRIVQRDHRLGCNGCGHDKREHSAPQPVTQVCRMLVGHGRLLRPSNGRTAAPVPVWPMRATEARLAPAASREKTPTSGNFTCWDLRPADDDVRGRPLAGALLPLFVAKNRVRHPEIRLLPGPSVSRAYWPDGFTVRTVLPPARRSDAAARTAGCVCRAMTTGRPTSRRTRGVRTGGGARGPLVHAPSCRSTGREKDAHQGGSVINSSSFR